MALQGSGSISFGQIQNEFGLPSGKNLGAYRVSESYGELSNMPLDIGVPQSGSIKFSDFYGKQLNVVVNCYTGGTQNHLYARTKWNNNSVNVVGGFRGKPASSAGTRAIVHLNKTIRGNGVDGGSGFVCSFKTGPWESDTNLDVHIGTQGKVIGEGGKGGDGGSRNNGNKNGQRAASGFGVQYPIDLWNYGIIAGGGGGGAGGAGESRDVNSRSRNRRRCGWFCTKRSRRRRRDRRRQGGGGGGGGAGFPAGNPGAGPGSGSNGSSGSLFSGGSGGSGGPDGARSGTAGGNLGENGRSNDGKSGGSAGRAIVISGGSITYKVSGDIRGSTYNGAPYV